VTVRSLLRDGSSSQPWPADLTAPDGPAGQGWTLTLLQGAVGCRVTASPARLPPGAAVTIECESPAGLLPSRDASAEEPTLARGGACMEFAQQPGQVTVLAVCVQLGPRTLLEHRLTLHNPAPRLARTRG